MFLPSGEFKEGITSDYRSSSRYFENSKFCLLPLTAAFGHKKMHKIP